ncbi:conjugal transfer protein TraG N-terminal domain-containing protein [Pseudomonas qingdaonensis]|uniref:conjugal transfer protein TraG N-terminal domain-containing protein n=1 Tax=Pseudomonas qingdaonensis TaxID=2056231 RepID=UPI00265E0B04|nr:conjugal transfer protein TraG N-terminal domain-containing protein [Pseudomonas qingdaonensis]WKL67294.1 conjugal transfer protein TraG N-terminal domain-containing protein [Pseudomonas qingdaonensis]
MSLNIYTTGSAEFLEIMLNASAMITSSGTSEDLARIGLMLGLLYLGFQAVWNAQGISFHKAGLLLVLYLIFYGPTTTAVIEDTTSGQVRVVDNVPVGPTFIGSVISTVAYEITRVSEQAFSTPTMTDYGLFSSLTTISRVRDALRNPMSLDSYVNYRRNDGWNLPKSVDEFITFCTLNPIALREYQDIDQLYRASGVEGVLNAPMTSQYVFIHDGVEAGGRLISCSQAQSIINNALQAVYTDLLDDILAKGFAAEKAAGKMTNGVDVAARTDAAIHSMAVSAKNAQSYTTMALIVPIFGDARVNALNHWQEQNAAMALRESLNQQEVQWAGKGDIFKHYMRPMIAFFEGLLYAMTPFMAFALVLGGAGLSILGKYMMLPLAVGLWMPLLSIVNAFTLWYAGAEAQSVFDAYDPAGQGFAMLQVLDLDQAVSKALGIGGLLAASVPPLALFIVSGSAMVANGIMSQMTAGEKFKSEDVLPRAKNQAPALNTTATYTSDQIAEGVSRTGAMQLTESFTGEQMAAASVQSAKTASNTATAGYQESLKAAGQQMNTTAIGRQGLAQIGETMAAGSTLSTNASYTDAKETLRGLGLSESSLNQATANASLGISTPLGGLKRTDGTSVDSMTKEDRSKANKALSQLTDSVQATDSTQLTFAFGDTFSRSDIAQRSNVNTDEIAKNRSSALAAQETYSEVLGKQDSMKGSQTLTLRDAAVQANKKGTNAEESSRDLAAMAMQTETGRQYFRAAMDNTTLQQNSTDQNELRSMAAIRALNQDGRLGELLNSQYNPLDFNVAQGDASQNKYIADEASRATADVGNIGGKFDSVRSSNNGEYASTLDMNQSGYDETKASGAEAIKERAAQNLEPVYSKQQDNNAEVDRQFSQSAYDTISERGLAAMQGTNLGKIVSEGTNAVFTGTKVISSAFGLNGGIDEKRQELYEQGVSNGLDDVEAQYYAAKASGEFGASSGDAYRELTAHYRSQGIRDEQYIAGAISAIDAAAQAPEIGTQPSLATLNESRAAVVRDTRPSTSNEDVPPIPQSNPKPSITN